jgi:hypothetical protein
LTCLSKNLIVLSINFSLDYRKTVVIFDKVVDSLTIFSPFQSAQYGVNMLFYRNNCGIFSNKHNRPSIDFVPKYDEI